jgi:hypothetical protein
MIDQDYRKYCLLTVIISTLEILIDGIAKMIYYFQYLVNGKELTCQYEFVKVVNGQELSCYDKAV